MRIALLIVVALAACGGDEASPRDTTAPDTTVAPETTAATEVIASETVAPDDTVVTEVAPEDTVETVETVADTAASETTTEVVEPDPVAWDPDATPIPCAGDAPAALLDQAFSVARLTLATFGYTTADFERSTKYYQGGFLDDPFLIAWQRVALSDPLRAPCVGDRVAVELDEVLGMAHPVAGAIRHAARELDLWPTDDPEVRPFDATTFTSAVTAICDAANSACTAPAANVIPAELAADLTPILVALADGIRASQALQVAAPTALSLGDWITRGGFGAHLFAPYNLLTDQAVQGFLANKQLVRPIVVAAARIAFEVQEVDWSRWRGQSISADIPTTAGMIRIRGAGDDTYPNTLTQVLLLVDLGGDDVHEDDVAAVRPGGLGVSVAIDLDGADQYGYAAVASDRDRPWLLPTDDGNRYAGDENYGFASASRHGRQGSGRLGIGLLFDLNHTTDTYRSLTQSQGYAHLGVGVLFDDGGVDDYAAEESSQGSSAFGIGMLIDREGDDHYASIAYSQGAGAPGGIGVLHDGGGDDTYFIDPGFPLEDGTKTATYFSPQMPGQANSSSSQGAGTGIRGDASGYFMSGGLGVLRDVGGDDHYTCGLFCQGGAFWQGIGILSDGAGADTYAALWYVQGGAAHYSIALLLDGGPGNDEFNPERDAVNVHMGGGHDFSLGMLVNEAGDDHYRFGSLAAGASNCNGIGLLVDNGGDDIYDARGTANAGFGSLGAECRPDPDRPLATSIGLFIDGGGTDTWSYPEADFTPADDATWHNAGTLDTEHGAGVDGVGETGMHAH